MRTDARQRTFACIVYPESAPEDWRNKLSDLHIQALVSPLHSEDQDSNGNKKKPHYHVLAYFEGKKSDQQVMDMFSTFGGVGLLKVESKKGYARYLIHLDDPEKAQYKATDIRCYGGASFEKWAEMDSDPMLYIADIMDFIERHDVLSLYQLARYCKKYRPEWHKILATRSTIYFKEYLKSRTWEGSRREDTEIMIDEWEKSEDC